MSSDHEAEIRASVAAHQDLGSGYDEAVAEGLVERIGAEIDKRIDARLGSFGTQYGPVPGAPGVPALQVRRCTAHRESRCLRRLGRVWRVRRPLEDLLEPPGRVTRGTRPRPGTRVIWGIRVIWGRCCRPATRWGLRRCDRPPSGSATWPPRLPPSGPWLSASPPRRSCRGPAAPACRPSW